MWTIKSVAALVVLERIFFRSHGIAEVAIGQTGNFHLPVAAFGQGARYRLTESVAAFLGDFPRQGNQYQVVDAHNLEQGLVGKALGR